MPPIAFWLYLIPAVAGAGVLMLNRCPIGRGRVLRGGHAGLVALLLAAPLLVWFIAYTLGGKVTAEWGQTVLDLGPVVSMAAAMIVIALYAARFPETPAGTALRWTPVPTQVRLNIMMFLQYFIQGCYLPIVSVYLRDGLDFTPAQIGYFGSAIALGTLVAPFILGYLIDRLIATQYVLAASHLLGGACMVAIYVQTAVWPVLILGVIYSILYVPSLMLTNSLTFHHLASRDREFPIVRVWGTIGFVVPAWLIEMVFLRGLSGEELNQGRAVALLLAGVAGVLMGAYCLSLPHTPPPKRDVRDFAPGKVIGLMRFRNFFVLVLVTFGIAIVHKSFFVINSPYLNDVLKLGGEAGWEQRISSIGQISEIAVMAGLALLLVRVGFKWTMALGAFAYVARCAVLALAWEVREPFNTVITIVCLGQALHGFCFGCFLAAAYMYVDRFSPKDIRGSMQNVYGTFVIGLGFFAGGFIAGWITEWFTVGEGETARQAWTPIWLVTGVLGGVCLLAFVIAFPKREPAEGGGDVVGEQIPEAQAAPVAED